MRTPEEFLRSLAPLDSRDVQKAPRPRPVAKRVWASLEKDPGEVIEEAILEAKHRDAGQTKRWVALVDGNPHQLDLPRAMRTFANLLPVPQPTGRVIGNPADATAVVVDAQAGLPEDVPVEKQPLAIPPNAGGTVVRPEVASATITAVAPTAVTGPKKN